MTKTYFLLTKFNRNISNIANDTENFCNNLAKTVDNRRLIIDKLKLNLEYRGNAYFEPAWVASDYAAQWYLKTAKKSWRYNQIKQCHCGLYFDSLSSKFSQVSYHQDWRFLTQAVVRGYEVRGVFLCILKPLDKVQHDGIIHKLKRNEISGNLLSLLTDLLRNKKRYSYS